MKINLPTIEAFINELKDKEIKEIYGSVFFEVSEPIRRAWIIFSGIDYKKQAVFIYKELIGQTNIYDKGESEKLENKIRERREELLKKLSEFIVKDGWVE